jgi:hypothetical protein
MQLNVTINIPVNTLDEAKEHINSMDKSDLGDLISNSVNNVDNNTMQGVNFKLIVLEQHLKDAKYKLKHSREVSNKLYHDLERDLTKYYKDIVVKAPGERTDRAYNTFIQRTLKLYDDYRNDETCRVSTYDYDKSEYSHYYDIVLSDKLINLIRSHQKYYDVIDKKHEILNKIKWLEDEIFNCKLNYTLGDN